MTTRFVTPSKTNSARLNTFMDTVIAMTWTRDAKVPTVIEGVREVRQAAEAYLISIDLEAGTAVPQGTTLVFPQVLQQVIRNAKGQYVIGTLRTTMQESGRTLIELEDLDPEEFEAAVDLVLSNHHLAPVGTDLLDYGADNGAGIEATATAEASTGIVVSEDELKF